MIGASFVLQLFENTAIHDSAKRTPSRRKPSWSTVRSRIISVSANLLLITLKALSGAGSRGAQSGVTLHQEKKPTCCSKEGSLRWQWLGADCTSKLDKDRLLDPANERLF